MLCAMLLPSCAPGEDSEQSDLPDRMRVYADSIVTPGFWLDIPDAALLSEHHQKRLFVAVDKPVLEFQSVVHYLSSTLPEDMRFEDDEETTSPRPGDFALLSCNAVYNTMGEHNHYMPLILKGGVQESVWHQLTTVNQAELALKIEELNGKISHTNKSLQECRHSKKAPSLRRTLNDSIEELGQFPDTIFSRFCNYLLLDAFGAFMFVFFILHRYFML